MNPRKTLAKILAGSRNIRFADMANLVAGFGFHLSRTSGSHHIFSRPGIPELVNLQEVRGEAKPYQIRQFIKLVERYNLRLLEVQQAKRAWLAAAKKERKPIPAPAYRPAIYQLAS